MIKRVTCLFALLCILACPLSVYAKDKAVKVNSLSDNVTLNEGFIGKNDLIIDGEVLTEYVESEQSTPENIPNIGCKGVYLIHPETGKVLFQKNPYEKMYPASTTKIMTALMALENCDMDDTAVVSKKALSLVPKGYSSAKLEAEEEFTIYTLLQALLIPSGNEAANALAQHISGDIDSFADLCNKRAAELGCKNLHFINPNGVHSDNHYCCAYDMYLIARECKKYDAFNEIVKSKYFTVPTTKIHPENDRVLENTNKLLFSDSYEYYYPYCTGIKTGHTEEAGECLISSASKDGIDLMCVVLGGSVKANGLNERFYDTKQLYEFAYADYGYLTVSEKWSVYANIEINNAAKETSGLDLIIDEDIKTLAPLSMDKDDVECEITLLDNIKAPIKQGQPLGTITFKVDGLNYTTNLVAKNDVKKNQMILYLIVIFFVSLLISSFINSRDKKRRKKNRK